jgi:hypothetical protein
MNARHLVLVAAALSATGCYRTTIVNGRPEAPPDAIPALNGSTHGGYVNGIAEDNPLHLQHLCKQGWATIKVESGFITTLANAAYGLIFHGQDVTVKCVDERTAPPVAPGSPAAPPSAPAPVPTAPATSDPSRI